MEPQRDGARHRGSPFGIAGLPTRLHRICDRMGIASLPIPNERRALFSWQGVPGPKQAMEAGDSHELHRRVRPRAEKSR